MGALFATAAALYLPSMPGPLHIFVCSIAGMIGGGIWGAIPGFLRAYHDVNEVIVTLLMNYVAIHITSYFVNGPMMEANAPYPYSPEIPESLWLPFILPGTDAHMGIVIGVILAIALYVVFTRTSLGLAMSMVGNNPKSARYAGLKVNRYIVLSLAAGGALGGLAGTYEILGLKYRLFHLFSDGYGYEGIVVALLAAGNPLWSTVSAMFLAGLNSGAGTMQRIVGVPTTAVDTIQGLVVIFVASGVALQVRANKIGWLRRLLEPKTPAVNQDQEDG